MRLSTIIVIFSALTALTSCGGPLSKFTSSFSSRQTESTGFDLASTKAQLKAQDMQMPQSQFAGMQSASLQGPQAVYYSTLSQHYYMQSTKLYNSGRTQEAEVFKTKSISAAKGMPVPPFSPQSLRISQEAMARVSSHYQMLLSIKGHAKSMKFVPDEVAKLQVNYDCMLIELKFSSRGQCYQDFNRSLSIFQKLLQKQPPRQHHSHSVRKVTHSGKKHKRTSYNIYFESGSHKVGPSALTVLDILFKDSRRCSSRKVIVSGFADASGSHAANARIASKRARDARRALYAKGFTRDEVTLENYSAEYSSSGNSKFSAFDRKVMLDLICYN